MKTMLIILTKDDVVNEFFSNEREDPVNPVVPNYSETRGDFIQRWHQNWSEANHAAAWHEHTTPIVAIFHSTSILSLF